MRHFLADSAGWCTPTSVPTQKHQKLRQSSHRLVLIVPRRHAACLACMRCTIRWSLTRILWRSQAYDTLRYGYAAMGVVSSSVMASCDT